MTIMGDLDGEPIKLPTILQEAADAVKESEIEDIDIPINELRMQELKRQTGKGGSKFYFLFNI